MKKIFLIIAFFTATLSGFAQLQLFEGLGIEEVDAARKAEMVAINTNVKWLVFDTTASQYQYWDGDSWESLGVGTFPLYNDDANDTEIDNYTFETINGNLILKGNSKALAPY